MNRALLSILVAATLFSSSAFAAAPDAAAEPWREVAKSDPVLSERLVDLAAERGDAPLKAWVFFTDKGITDAGAFGRALSVAERALTGKAMLRRQKTQRGGFLVGHHDLPVIRAYVEQVLATGARQRALSRYLNGVSVEAPIETLRSIAALPFVRAVTPVRAGTREPARPDRPIREKPRGKTEKQFYNLNYGSSLHQLEMMQVPELHDRGLDGSGVRICMLDSGFKRTHESLLSVNVIAERDFINDDGNTAPEAGDPSNQHSHGTTILSLIAGYRPGDLIGPAYNAEYLLGKTEDMSQEEPIEEDWWVEGIEWADSMGADLVSSSLGYNDWYAYEDMDGNTATTTVAADLAAWNGILVCVSAGNEGSGSWTYVTAPADADSVITVGAVWSDTIIASFSSRGPTYDDRIKPTLVAQGVYDYSASAYEDDAYGDCHGTSCSTPILAGAAALLLQANPSWNNMDLIETLKSTATQSASPDTAMGWGLIQVAAALDQITAVQNERDLIGWAGVPTPPVSRLAIAAAPNPFNPKVTLRITMSRAAVLSVRVFDARGSLVDTLYHDVTSAGETRIVWDGKDTRGRDVPSGVYFAHAVSEGSRTTEKLNLVR
ncbi:MAG: S8 family serine peptidase [Candidatus Eisenbacteria bacterium]|nr:S8 family serine peptidase [Candidatus Eisenbacteria bacterium]